ncbi:MAG: flagellar hook-basal body protein [Defluviitaleaceae bacterium]|nr:flagellar hook-basal body protein [Defluviitaleaceae bacterium]
MLRGIYTSAVGMTTQMNRMDVLSNNIANANTNGFKRDTVVTRSFSDELMLRINDRTDFAGSRVIGNIRPGVFVDDIFVDFSTGPMEITHGTLDLAISGRGFFVVQDADRNGNTIERFTRDGSLTLNADGVLMTNSGQRILGELGEITLPAGYVTVTDLGEIYVDGEFIDTLRIVNFEDKHTLRKHGHNLFNTTDQSVMIDFEGTIVQGALERSNVNSVREMVEMITVMRAYEANQRMITIQDGILSSAVNEIARR